MNGYFFITAMVLGVGGSLHCLGMCGPLALRFSGANTSYTSLLLYHLGRISVYGILGATAGFAGTSINSFFPYQQYLSLIAGLIMLLMLLLTTRTSYLQRITSPLLQFLSRFSSKQRSPVMKSFLQGTLNGVLPCGLVYVAMAASLGVGSIKGSAIYMLVFGWGTAPALLLLQLLGKQKMILAKLRIHYWLPALSFVTAILLILRGLNLGIPYISPEMNSEKTTTMSCH